jgi:Flp pilus assembly protein TadG
VVLRPSRILGCNRRRQEGAAAVEFALCLIPLLLIVGGIVDFGELWYIQSVLSTASREGARYATRYQTVGGVRTIPSNLSPLVADWVTSNYAGLVPSGANLAVDTPTGAGYTSGTAGQPVSVTVRAEKQCFFLTHLIPGLPGPQSLESTTVMTCE